MNKHMASLGIGLVAGMRTMTAGAALSWAASMGRSRIGWIPDGGRSRAIATVAALGEMAGDKMWFAPDRRIPASFAARLALGALGGAAFAPRGVPASRGALSGAGGAVVGTLLGRLARGGTTRSRSDWTRALAEDVLAAALGAVLVVAAERSDPA